MVTTKRSRRRGGGGELDRLVPAFDDERVVANAGLLLASTLAGRLGIEQIVDETLDLGERPGAARPGRKLLTLVMSALPFLCGSKQDCDGSPSTLRGS